MADGDSIEGFFSKSMSFAEKNWGGIAVVSIGVFAAAHHARKMWGQIVPATGKPGQLGGIIISVLFAGEAPRPPAAPQQAANG